MIRQAFFSISPLPDRGVVKLTGADGEKLLQGLITNDMGLLVDAPALHAGLLSPQGKILFEFFVVKDGDTFLLDVARARAGDLAKRLTMYKLRANVTISDVSSDMAVLAVWSEGGRQLSNAAGAMTFADPRHPEMGQRMLARADVVPKLVAATGAKETSPDAYDAHRIALGVPEGGKDYDFGDAYPHEANFDVLNGVSFAKGCYVGQEIVARMQHKAAIRKRVVNVTATEALRPDRPDVEAGGVVIGKLGSAQGTHGLALLRLDRAAEFAAKNVALTAGGVTVALAPAPWLPVLEASFAPQP